MQPRRETPQDNARAIAHVLGHGYVVYVLLLTEEPCAVHMFEAAVWAAFRASVWFGPDPFPQTELPFSQTHVHDALTSSVDSRTPEDDRPAEVLRMTLGASLGRSIVATSSVGPR
jgi:hypothetical protein